MLCGLPTPNQDLLPQLSLVMGSLGHGDTHWFFSGLVFQEIDKIGRIKPAMNSWH